MILPLRVLGRASVKRSSSGLANLPTSWATQPRISAWRAGLAVWPEVALPHRQGVPGVLSAHRKPGLGFEKEGLPWS